MVHWLAGVSLGAEMGFTLRTRDGKLDKNDQLTFGELKVALGDGNPRLHLHLHGGLVTEENGLQTAKAWSGSPPAGIGLTQPWQQAFVIWRTGVLETVQANWQDLFDNDHLYNALLKRLIEFISKKIGIPGADGRATGKTAALSRSEIVQKLKAKPAGDPFAQELSPVLDATSISRAANIGQRQTEAELADEFEAFLRADTEFNDSIASISASINSRAVGRGARAATPEEHKRAATMLERLNDEVSEPLRAKAPTGEAGRSTAFGVGVYFLKHAASIVIRVIRRLRTGRDHGFYATIVEELARQLYGDRIGATIWGMMKKDAEDHFQPGRLGAELLAAIPDGCRVVVTGHSAGSIWAAELIKAIASQKRNIKLDLILLAPAVRMDLFAAAIKAGGSNIERCRIFTMRDDLERADVLLGAGTGYLYPSSLLYLVSGLFEKVGADAMIDAPLLGLERFLNGAQPWLKEMDQISAINDVVSFFQAPGHDIVYSKSLDNALSGSRSRATSHGDFDNEHLTLESVATFFA